MSRVTSLLDIFGWFSEANAKYPERDPGLSAPCPLCGRAVRDKPIKTISVMPLGGSCSYFYRAHKDCYESAAAETITEIESAIIDMRLE